MSASSTRLVSLVPLAAGWRAVYARDTVEGELEAMSDDELFFVFPIAAIAHVELWYDDDGGYEDTELRLIPSGGDGLSSWRDTSDHFALLGPGETVEPWVRAEAVRAIELERHLRQQRRLESAA